MTSILELNNVTFRRNRKEILHDISFTVRSGEQWVMLGPNGAGKSTILAMCGALTHPTTGTVDVLGHRLGRVELQALRRRIGHVNPRHPLQSALRVTDVVLTGITGTTERPMRWSPSAQDVAKARHLIEILGLTALAEDRWPTLSQGERGRTLIARALISDPELLLLDEPSTGLDVAAREQLLDTISVLSQTHPDLASVLVTHHLEELPATTTHALLIAEGRVAGAGPVREVLTSEAVTATFNHPLVVDHAHGRWSARSAGVPSP